LADVELLDTRLQKLGAPTPIPLDFPGVKAAPNS
jgi:hypothetical protein